MNYKAIKISGVFLLLFWNAVMQAQAPLTPEQREKQIYEALEKSIEDYTESLHLNDAQIFYVDSILTHNMFAMDKEMKELADAKVANTDHYIQVQDKWAEKTYNAFHKILNGDQWAKYLKMGAAKEQKAREKRRDKK